MSESLLMLLLRLAELLPLLLKQLMLSSSWCSSPLLLVGPQGFVSCPFAEVVGASGVVIVIIIMASNERETSGLS